MNHTRPTAMDLTGASLISALLGVKASIARPAGLSQALANEVAGICPEPEADAPVRSWIVNRTTNQDRDFDVYMTEDADGIFTATLDRESITATGFTEAQAERNLWIKVEEAGS